MISSQISKRYAKVLFNVAMEQNAIEDIRGNLAVIHEAIKTSLELRGFLSNPLLSVPEQQKILKAVFEGKINAPLFKFILFLAYKGRLNALKAVAEDFENLYLVQKGIVAAGITSSVPITEDQKENIRRHLHTRTGKIIQDQSFVRPEVLGGARVQIGDFVYDGTLKTQLEKFKQGVVNM